jgi:hypothetical protein
MTGPQLRNFASRPLLVAVRAHRSVSAVAGMNKVARQFAECLRIARPSRKAQRLFIRACSRGSRHASAIGSYAPNPEQNSQ